MPRGPHACQGGPLDGYIVTPAAGKYSWITAKRARLTGLRHGDILRRVLPGKRPRFYEGGTARSEPRDGAALYEFTREGLVYAGYRRYLCPGCGAYHQKCEGGSERRSCAYESGDA